MARETNASAPPAQARLGLGIDAGGTYTDAVLYDLLQQQVRHTAKALTTRWDYTEGICNALDLLPAQLLKQVDMVCLSTTLATNATVEGQGQRVGLLVMPPYGLWDDDDISHRPLEVIRGRLEIDGTVLEPVDEEQVRQAARKLRDVGQVAAFAVAGYASHHNPDHELQVARIVAAETGCTVTCGHEVSALLNYRVRAQTAALNVRIIPCLVSFLDQAGLAMAKRGIHAPMLVVKSDGSLMSLQAARLRPIQTVLSGPAASVAGARRLTGLDNAMVVDMGGTTTDTATIENGQVRLCPQGASVGGFRTHVAALDLRATGLGGDSLITSRSGKLIIGPRRVVPVCCLASSHPGAITALDYLGKHHEFLNLAYDDSHLWTPTPRAAPFELDEQERQVLELLRTRPYSSHEIAAVLGPYWWKPRLEEHLLIQRCGLTPTDLLHAAGRFVRWDAAAATKACLLLCRGLKVELEELLARGQQQIVEMLALELIKKELADQVPDPDADNSPLAQALLQNFLDHGRAEAAVAAGSAAPAATPASRAGFRVRIELKHPVIGIGAPVHLFLPQAAALLHSRAVIPAHAEVANAVGAITSSVMIHKRVSIDINDQGEYLLQGLPGGLRFTKLEQAHSHAHAALTQEVLALARVSGAGESQVHISSHDQLARLPDGSGMFLSRVLEARLISRPDLQLLAQSA